MSNKTVVHVLKTEIIGTATNTYEIVKEIVDEKQKEAVVIQLYPTVGINDIGTTDSTTLHLQNKMRQLGWSKVHLLNLFSHIVKRKPLSADLPSVDEENMKYVKDSLKKLQDRCEIVIAWGNSHSSNKVVNEAKRRLLEHLLAMKKASVCQIVTDRMLAESEGTHILFLGLRHANDKWMTEPFPVQAEMERLAATLPKSKPSTAKTKKAQAGAKQKVPNDSQAKKEEVKADE